MLAASLSGSCFRFRFRLPLPARESLESRALPWKRPNNPLRPSAFSSAHTTNNMNAGEGGWTSERHKDRDRWRQIEIESLLWLSLSLSLLLLLELAAEDSRDSIVARSLAFGARDWRNFNWARFGLVHFEFPSSGPTQAQLAAHCAHCASYP